MISPSVRVLEAFWKRIVRSISRCPRWHASIKVALAGLLGIDLEVVGGNPHKVRFPAPASLPGASGVPYPHLLSFAFVRNPWARLVSCYRDKVLGKVSDVTSFDAERGVAHCLARFDAFRSGMSFDDFVTAVAAMPDEEADGHFRAQHTFVANPHGDTAVDFIGRYETLARLWLIDRPWSDTPLARGMTRSSSWMG